MTGGSHLVGTVVIARFDRDGRWDHTFGKGGQTIIRFDTFSGPELLARSTDVQPNGMIVIAGTRGNFPNKEIVLMRCRANGTLDSGFGKGGQVILAFGGESDAANAVTVQKDGKIVAAGQLDRGQFINSPHFAVIRYKADGTLDQSFGTGGVAVIKFEAISTPWRSPSRSSQTARSWRQVCRTTVAGNVRRGAVQRRWDARRHIRSRRHGHDEVQQTLE